MNKPVYLIVFLLAVCMTNSYAYANDRSEDGKAHPTPKLSFIENKGQVTDQYGQTRADIDIKLETPGMSIFIGKGKIHYQWYRQEQGTAPAPTNKQQQVPVEAYRMDAILVGANKNARLSKTEVQAQKFNYYLPQCPNGAIAHSYGRITYHDIYPNIDWVLYTTPEGGLKYDFVLRPGSWLADIKIAYQGSTSLALKEGALIAGTPMGSITEAAPYSYEAGTGKELASAFVLEGNLLSYRVAGAENRSFVIDPALQWATYFGGTLSEWVYGVAADTAGNGIIYGQTSSSSNIASIGAHQTQLTGTIDGYIAKFSSTGSLAWATYYGGSGTEVIQDLCTDKAGNIFFGGQTYSISGIATPGAHQSTASGHNGFLVKLNATGARQWGTYYPVTFVRGVACDPTGSIVITGQTGSNAGVATSGAHLTTIAPNITCGFIAKFNSTGTRLWGTYYPAVLDVVACDGNGNIIVASSSFASFALTSVATPGAHQTTPAGSHEACIAKFNSSGTRLWGSYYGGPGTDYLYALTCDAFGNIYVGGQTTSTSGMVTTGAFQTVKQSPASLHDGFIAKFSGSGQRQWGSYFYPISTITGMVAGPDGLIYCTGYVPPNINNFATPNAYQGSSGGNADMFLASFDQAGNRQYTTYYGGSAAEYRTSNATYGMAYTPTGKLYFTGNTESTSGIATSGAYQTSHGGGTYDALLVQFEIDRAVYIDRPTDYSHFCKGDSLHLSFGVTQAFNSNNVFTLQLSDANGSFSSPTNLATLTTPNGGSFHTTIPGTLVNGTGYRLRIAASSPAMFSLDNSADIIIGTQPPKPVATANAPICAGNNLSLSGGSSSTGTAYSWAGPNSFTATTLNATIPNATTAAGGTYIITADNNSCIAKDTLALTVYETPAGLAATSNGPVCSGTDLQLSASSTTAGVSYAWVGPGFSANQQNPTITNVQMSAAGTYTVTATNGGCSATASTTVSIMQSATVSIYASPGDSVCAQQPVQFTGFPLNAGTPQLQWYKNNSPLPGANSTVLQLTGLADGDQVYLEVIAGTGCNQPVKSEVVTMKVHNFTNTPSVMITANPGANVHPGTRITFTAHPQHGGQSPQYQWKKNNQNIPAAIFASYATSSLLPGDAISVEITSSDPCADPSKAISAPMYIGFPSSITERNKQDLLLYPNPNNGSFVVSGISGAEVKATIMNTLGQTVYQTNFSNVQSRLQLDPQLPAGTYLLKLTTGNRQHLLRFNVLE